MKKNCWNQGFRQKSVMRRSIQSLNIFPGIWLSNVPGGKGIGQFELCLAGMKFWTGSVKSFRWNTSASSWKWTCLKVNSLLSRSNGSEDRPWFWILQKNGSSIQLLGGPFEHNFGLEEGEGGGNFIKPIFKSSNAQGVAREDVEALGWSTHYLR